MKPPPAPGPNPDPRPVDAPADARFDTRGDATGDAPGDAPVDTRGDVTADATAGAPGVPPEGATAEGTREDTGPPARTGPPSPAGAGVVPTSSAGGRYRVVARHAQGGIGRIMLAHDTRLDRPVAIKEGLRHGEAAESRFLEEARITASLEHPGVVPVHDVGRWPEGQPFYVMKFVDGRPLKQVLAECRGLDARLALLPNVQAVVDAVAHAHSRSVVHLDLKPSNVLVGRHGETVVVDWGLARDLSLREGDGSGAVVSLGGTPAYMAPEQAGGGQVDLRTDVYALGAILYELLSGRPPYAGAPDSVVRAVRSGPPVDAGHVQPGIPRDLVAILAKAMARDPAHRYADASALGDDLRAFQNGRIVSARQYSPLVLMARWVRRHRAVVGISMAALGVLAVVVTGAVRGVLSATDQARQRGAELTLMHARNAVRRDPTESLAWLHALPADRSAAMAMDAQDLAVQAVESGAARDVLWLERGAARSLAFHRDGRTLVAAGRDTPGTTALLSVDVDTGRAVSTTAYAERVLAVARLEDGRAAALETPGDDPDIFDARWLQDTMGPAGAACTPRRGGWRAEARADGAVRVITRAAGEGRQLLPAHPVAALACDAEGRGLLLLLADGTVEAWAPGQARLQPVSWPGAAVTAVAWDAAGEPWLADAEGRVGPPAAAPGAATRVADGAHATRLVPHPSIRGRVAALLSRGDVVVLGSPEGAAVVLPVQGATALSWVPGGTRLAVGTERGHVVLLEDTRVVGHRRGMAVPITAVAVSGDGRRLAAASEDGALRVFDGAGDMPWPGPRVRPAGAEQRWPVPAMHDAPPPLLAASSPDGTWWVGVDAGGVLHAVDAARGQVIRRVPLGRPPRAVAPSHGGAGAWILLDRDALAWMDARDTSLRRVALEDEVTTLVSVRGGALLGRADGALQLVTRDGAPSAAARVHAGGVRMLVASPGGDAAASAGLDLAVVLHRVDAGAAEPRLRLAADATALAFSPDGRLLAVGERSGVVRVVSVSHAAVLHAWSHDEPVTRVALDGTTLEAEFRSGAVLSVGVADTPPPALPALLARTRARIQPNGRPRDPPAAPGTTPAEVTP